LILLATNKRDITTDFIVLELQRRGAPYLRLNTEDMPDLLVRMPEGDPDSTMFVHKRGEFRVSDVAGAYYRRPGTPRHQAETSPVVAEYIMTEWSALLRTLWNALDGKWLNSPYAIQRAEDKPRQLAAAREAGLQIPDTLVSNDFEAARSFTRVGGFVVKPLRRALLEDADGPGRVIFTSRLSQLQPADSEAVRMAPLIFQREIPKRADIRATVIDNVVLAASIGSQAHPDTRTDWRRGSRSDLAYEVVELPEAISSACVRVVSQLGLRFAAIDLIEDNEGDYWFLEANPNGQWAWIEQRTGLPIAGTIVDALERG